VKIRFQTLPVILTLSFLFFLPLLSLGQKSSGGDRLLGKWLSSTKKSVCLIYKKGQTYEGKITWYVESYDENGNILTDQNNPDPDVRDRPVIGLVILKDLTYSGNDTWSGGTIYMPRTGKTYDCKLTMQDKDSVEVTAYIGLSFFGKSGIWTRQ
jgi:uncharacterized protein (DUF2147 family)